MKIFSENNACHETDDRVYFYTPKHYCLDNFSAFSITIWGQTFATSEHAYQWKKYGDSAPEIAKEILNATSPNETKRIADRHPDEVSEDFITNKVVIMEEILSAKLAQHEKVRRVLAETGTKHIYENSPTDNYWGVGEDGDGKNVLGKLWVKLREEVV